ncbi:endonuclease/exonuclease/phosphatase family protein [Actinomadura formosensis]|uniref:endonuclease/exonuclease/phosphatase family protein n=1 Tax=Actinomadura formosensis TaxID=60706 RepID=UPI003D93486F
MSTAIRVASVNWNYGGIDADGSDARWHQTVEALRRARPQVVLCQELGVPQPALRQSRHVRRTANALEMEPVLGPVVPAARSALHTAILVDTHTTGWRIVDDGPYPGTDPSTAHAWCMVELHIPGLDRPLCCFSVHFPARSAVAQLSQAQYLGALVALRPQLALIGGDFNCYPRGGPSVTADELERLPRHLQVTRCRQDPQGRPEANYDVDDTFARAGLIDIAAHLPPTRRDPPHLRPTGRGGARVDRVYGSPELATAATLYRHITTGSDHDALVLDLDLVCVADAPPVATAPTPAVPRATPTPITSTS